MIKLKKEAQSKPKNKLSKEELEQWNNLYAYVKKEILMYDDNQNVPSEIVLRIKGLCKGKVIANNATKDNADYSFEILLYTFKLCKSKILSAIYGKTFQSEISKFVYISKIVEGNINEIYERVTTAKKSQAKMENIKVDSLYHDAAQYMSTVIKENEKLKNLW